MSVCVCVHANAFALGGGGGVVWGDTLASKPGGYYQFTCEVKELKRRIMLVYLV